MFPRNTPGVALVILRLAVAATLWGGGAPACLSTAAATPALILVEGLLCVGLLTPAAAAVCAAVHVAAFLCGDGQQALSAVVAIANAAALAMLGPGAYSVDGRVFGRRVFVVSGRSGAP